MAGQFPRLNHFRSRPPCLDHFRNRCTLGRNCKYTHDYDRDQAELYFSVEGLLQVELPITVDVPIDDRGVLRFVEQCVELKPDLKAKVVIDYATFSVKLEGLPDDVREASDFLHSKIATVYKRKICKYWQRGKCFNGDVCSYAHGQDDIPN